MWKNLIIDPVAKPRMTQRDKWMVRKPVAKYRKYCENLRKFENTRKIIDWDKLEIKFFLPVPRSWSGKKKFEKYGNPHTQRPDIDNLLKGFMDALLPEDSQIWNVKVTKLWGTEGSIYVKCKDV